MSGVHAAHVFTNEGIHDGYDGWRGTVNEMSKRRGSGAKMDALVRGKQKNEWVNANRDG